MGFGEGVAFLWGLSGGSVGPQWSLRGGEGVVWGLCGLYGVSGASMAVIWGLSGVPGEVMWGVNGVFMGPKGELCGSEWRRLCGVSVGPKWGLSGIL